MSISAVSTIRSRSTSSLRRSRSRPTRASSRPRSEAMRARSISSLRGDLGFLQRLHARDLQLLDGAPALEPRRLQRLLALDVRVLDLSLAAISACLTDRSASMRSERLDGERDDALLVGRSRSRCFWSMLSNFARLRGGDALGLQREIDADALPLDRVAPLQLRSVERPLALDLERLGRLLGADALRGDAFSCAMRAASTVSRALISAASTRLRAISRAQISSSRAMRADWTPIWRDAHCSAARSTRLELRAISRPLVSCSARCARPRPPSPARCAPLDASRAAISAASTFWLRAISTSAAPRPWRCARLRSCCSCAMRAAFDRSWRAAISRGLDAPRCARSPGAASRSRRRSKWRRSLFSCAMRAARVDRRATISASSNARPRSISCAFVS